MIVSVPERLLYIRVLVPKELRSEAISKLQELGVIHVEFVGEIPEEDKVKLESEFRRVSKLLKYVADVEGLIEERTFVEVTEEVPAYSVERKLLDLEKVIEKIREEVMSIKSKVDELSDKLNKLSKLREVLNSLVLYGLGKVRLSYLYFDGYVVSSRTFLGKKGSIDELLRMIDSLSLEVYDLQTYDLSGERKLCVVVCSPQVISKLSEIARKLGIEELQVPQVDRSINDFISELSLEIDKLERELNELKSKLKEVIGKSLKDIALAKVLASVLKERLEVLLNALAGNYLLGIEGWVPVAQVPKLESELANTIKYVYIAKLSTDKEPPTKLRNPKPLRIFEIITKIYGIPGYNEWDPTPIISYSLMIFFGLMFSDVIYGALMFILINYVLERTGLVDNPYSEGYLTFKKLLTCLSISSMVFGFLSNSYAGYSIVITNGIPHLEILKQPAPGLLTVLPLTNPMFFIKLALIIGLVHVNIAHILALLKAIRARDKGEIVSKTGFFIAEIFGIPYVLYSFLHIDLGPLSSFANILLYGAIAGVIILVAGKFISFKALGALFWLFDITGLLGDVMSYTRLAGIGLATSLLAQNFNSLALSIVPGMESMIPIKLVGLAVGALMALVVMVFANLLNIVFGILGAFIHSLRLCFVEFLPKFYEGNGREFKPFTLAIPRVISLGKPR